jgi:aspartyl-tRNA(Asn)/glutamyl-tRNA(Gln) amidotransferase subunit B
VTTAARPDGGVLQRYEAVIGIEIHCQLRTSSKMFCSCSTAYDGAAPNTHVCPVCLGLPGALPVINRRAVEFVIATGLAIEAEIPERTQWERKNYFYPDLPKGYQISQYAIPLAGYGRLRIETSDGLFTVGIRRAHLEEDTAKLIHADAAGPTGRRASLVDFNRSGAPLMEIVTEADIRTAEQARRYAEELQLLLRAIGVSDADMERGQMRVEANVSLRPRGEEAFGTRVEVKNMNSFRAVERAIEFEIERQGVALDAGEPLVMETRGWDDGRQATYHMRSKETSEDYRYFPEPDLPPLRVAQDWIDGIRAELPELPAARRDSLRSMDVPAKQAEAIVASKDLSTFFDLVHEAAPDLTAPTVANWTTQEYAAASNTNPSRNDLGLVGSASIDSIVDILRREAGHELTRTNAREALTEHIATGQASALIVEEHGFTTISDDGALLSHVDAVIAANPRAVADYRAGKPVTGFFVGQVMKATRGAADAARVGELVRARLDGEDPA